MAELWPLQLSGLSSSLTRNLAASDAWVLRSRLEAFARCRGERGHRVDPPEPSKRAEREADKASLVIMPGVFTGQPAHCSHFPAARCAVWLQLGHPVLAEQPADDPSACGCPDVCILVA
jgi:hypothetical protein